MKTSSSVILFTCVSFFTAGNALAQAAAIDLTGGLPMGKYAVGFRSTYYSDDSRTWKFNGTRPGKDFTPDTSGRPVRVEMWYPAEKPGGAMTYADYINIPAPRDFAEAARALEQRDHTIATLSVPASKLDELLRTHVFATKDAQPAAGRFPLLIHFPGLNDAQALNAFIMAEYLASHGYVVAVVSLLGVSNMDTDQHRNPVGLETDSSRQCSISQQ